MLDIYTLWKRFCLSTLSLPLINLYTSINLLSTSDNPPFPTGAETFYSRQRSDKVMVGWKIRTWGTLSLFWPGGQALRAKVNGMVEMQSSGLWWERDSSGRRKTFHNHMFGNYKCQYEIRVLKCSAVQSVSIDRESELATQVTDCFQHPQNSAAWNPAFWHW